METITLKIPVLVNSGCTYKPNEKFFEDKEIKKTIENSDEIETMMIIQNYSK